MKQKIIAIYSLIIGIGILWFWATTVIQHSYFEGNIEISFHILSETILGMLSILGGILLLKRVKSGSPISLAAHSMMIYSVLNAAGYYAERGNHLAIFSFVAAFIISALIFIFLLKHILNTSA